MWSEAPYTRACAVAVGALIGVVVAVAHLRGIL